MITKVKEYLELAYEEALKAYEENEVPVGAVLVYEDKVVAIAHNSSEKDNCMLKHAEMNAVNKALEDLNTKQLKGSSIYITLEPCLMCLGALINAQVSKVYFGALDANEGAFSHHHVSLTTTDIEVHYVEDKRFKSLMTDFFKKVRSK